MVQTLELPSTPILATARGDGAMKWTPLASFRLYVESSIDDVHIGWSGRAISLAADNRLHARRGSSTAWHYRFLAETWRFKPLFPPPELSSGGTVLLHVMLCDDTTPAYRSRACCRQSIDVNNAPTLYLRESDRGARLAWPNAGRSSCRKGTRGGAAGKSSPLARGFFLRLYVKCVKQDHHQRFLDNTLCC
jgi:hypothetical protein